MDAGAQAVCAPAEAEDPRAAELRRDLQLMKDYLLLCVRKEDWHGVMDAAADIREIIARLGMLR